MFYKPRRMSKIIKTMKALGKTKTHIIIGMDANNEIVILYYPLA